MKDSVEILALITKDYPVINGDNNKFERLTKGFERDKYFNFLKVLKGNTIFSLNNNFKIEYVPKSSISAIKTSEPIDLYSSDKPKIQVNAIVGKNGSGKSTISEILYLMMYNLAVNEGFIKDENKTKIKRLKGFLNAILVVKLKNKFLAIDFEILDFFEYKYSKKDDSRGITFYCKEFDNNYNSSVDFKKNAIASFDFKDLFYMISLNYSMYGLNERKMGSWIKDIFHKNDMYETPIVINPYRRSGNIDVNIEDTQSNARVISNISKREHNNIKTLSSDYNYNQLNVFYDTNNPKSVFLNEELEDAFSSNLEIQKSSGYPYGVEIERHYNPYLYFDSELESENHKNKKIQNLDNFIPLYKDRLPVKDIASILLNISPKAFTVIHKYFYNIKSNKDLKEISTNLLRTENVKITVDLFSYYISKLFRIGITYRNQFGGLINSESNGFNEGEEFELTLKKVLMSESHACYKLKRVFYFINFSRGKNILTPTFEALSTNKEDQKENNIFAWNLNELNNNHSKYLNYLNHYEKSSNKPEYNNKSFYEIDKHFFEINDVSWRVPPPIFQTNCILQKNNKQETKVDLNELSSGESQIIYALQTILYHIINIESNEEYKNIILLLDEIELYYHPEYQRTFLTTLLTQINELNLSHIENVQIIFLTHSPFILSDIPSSNILRLKDGIPKIEERQTFGANIHDLLANDFFLENGFMGEFAKTQIEETIEYLNSEILKIEKSKLTEKLKNKGLKESKKKVYENELNEINKNLNSIKVKNSNRKFHQNVIGLIGEPVLRNKLGEMMASIMSNENKKKYLEEQFNIIAKNAGININNIKFED